MKIPTAPKAIDYFARVAAAYDANDGVYTAATAALYKELLQEITLPRGRLLEVGIGTGALALAFKEDGYDVYGIDGAPEMLAECRKNGIPDTHLVCADLDKYGIPYEDETFTLTVTSASLVYMQEAVQVISEMIRVTENGGVIVIDPHTHINNFGDTVPYLHGSNTPPYHAVSAELLENLFEEFNVQVLSRTATGPVQDLTNHPTAGLIQTEDVIYLLRRQL